jgi:hypothetical protein
MAIKFFCKCGKKLKARDEMAGRRSMCPRCGSPVGIPGANPTHPGGKLGPMTIKDRLEFWKTHLPSEAIPKSLLPDEIDEKPSRDVPRLASSEPSFSRDAQRSATPNPPYFDGPLNRSLIRQVLRSCRKIAAPQERRLETRWYQCLLYPFRAWPLVFGLGTALTLCVGFSALIHRQIQQSTQGISAVTIYAMWASIPIVIFSYTYGFLDCVMAGALAGEFRHVRWPGRNFGLAVKSCFTWGACFLAGPIVPSALAVYFWLQAGEMQIIDWMIMTELVLVAFGYWILVLLTVNAKEGIRYSNPLTVTELVGRLGWASLGIVLGAAVVALVHVFWAIGGLSSIQRDESGGWFLLILCSWSAMFWATFLFRWLGIWCHRLELTAPRTITSK